MGTIVDKPVQTVEIEVVAEDGDADDQIAKLELLEDGVVVNTTGPLASTCRWAVSWRPEPGPHYYFVKLTQADGNVLWSGEQSQTPDLRRQSGNNRGFTIDDEGRIPEESLFFAYWRLDLLTWLCIHVYIYW